MTIPYQFYPCHKSCPGCRAPLITHTPLTRRFTQGLLHEMGLTCTCVRCNTRYRAFGRIRYGWVAWLGPLGRRLWWQAASLEVTLQPPSEPGPAP